jgi:hypothetical protein
VNQAENAPALKSPMFIGVLTLPDVACNLLKKR